MRPTVSLRALLNTAVFIATLVATLALTGCSRPLGYGVLLWSEDEAAVRSGTVVSVLSESDLQDTYELRVDSAGEEFTIPRWRVRFFETLEAAEAESEEYSEVATVYARATRNALPMRRKPDNKSDNIIYRLREGEEIKIIGRDEETTNLSGLVSYWYRALTSTGVSAYVFGYELDLFDPLDPSAEFAETGSADPYLQMLIGNVWRPIYFVDMISNGAYDFELFRPEYGLFPQPDDQLLELVLPYHTIEFEYERIENVGPRKYLAVGSNLQITFNRGDELSLQYVHNERQFILAMQRVEGEIQDYIDAELERREETLERLLERGPVFTSGNYGRITLLEDHTFIWSGYERLVPAAIPAGIGTQGTVDLGLYLGTELSDEYDGAIAFKFNGNPNPVSFAYTLVPDGMRMLYVPPGDIDDVVITGSGVSSITLFFSASGG